MLTSGCIWTGRDIKMKPNHKPFYEYKMAVRGVKEGHEPDFEGGLFNLTDEEVGAVERLKFR